MTAVFIWPVGYGSGADEDFGVKRIKFGEGYGQRRQDLINAVKGQWPIRIKDNVSKVTTIRQFLRTNGVAGFDWTPPGASTPVRVTCDSTKVTYPSYDTMELTATFIQEFEP